MANTDLLSQDEIDALLSGVDSGEVETEIAADIEGIVIGRSNMPVVYEGEALFHIAETPRADDAAEGVTAHLEAAPLYDEDEII